MDVLVLALYYLDFHELELSLLLASLVCFFDEELGTIAMMAFGLMVSMLCSSSDASWLIAFGLMTFVLQYPISAMPKSNHLNNASKSSSTNRA